MPTKRRGRVWLGLILLVGGIAAAGYGYTLYYRARILDKSPLTDSPCAPPCWQDMTPGDRITPEEAAQRIRQVPSVRVVEVQSVRGRDGIMLPTRITYVDFEWLWWPGSRAFWEPSNTVRIEEDTLVAIHLYLNYKVTVEDILARFGTRRGHPMTS